MSFNRTLKISLLSSAIVLSACNVESVFTDDTDTNDNVATGTLTDTQTNSETISTTETETHSTTETETHSNTATETHSNTATDTHSNTETDTNIALVHGKELAVELSEQLNVAMAVQDELMGFGSNVADDFNNLENDGDSISAHFSAISQISTLTALYLIDAIVLDDQSQEVSIDFDLLPSSASIESYNSSELFANETCYTDYVYNPEINDYEYIEECESNYPFDSINTFSGDFEFNADTLVLSVNSTTTVEYTNWESQETEYNTITTSFSILLPNLTLDINGQIHTALVEFNSEDDFVSTIYAKNLYLTVDFKDEFANTDIFENGVSETDLEGISFGLEQAIVQLDDIILTGSGSLNITGDFSDTSDTAVSHIDFSLDGSLQNSKLEKLSASTTFSMDITDGDHNGTIDLITGGLSYSIDYSQAFTTANYIELSNDILFEIEFIEASNSGSIELSNDYSLAIGDRLYAYAIELLVNIDNDTEYADISYVISSEKDNIATSLVIAQNSNATPDDNNILNIGSIVSNGEVVAQVKLDIENIELIAVFTDSSEIVIFNEYDLEEFQQKISADFEDSDIYL
ncbi:hypothetical protein [Marinicellulosiphila megalodicopiae]|uniref:hypothetical protein n=1 Tax=Marinicellulosiphila megalodicopiae TaxID=2724896 RepID=UPI003BB18183